MPKILVADDNSNVQKTVALALAGLGVEVVAVNNGDAAVRKLPDVKPDLVLADIFMPVRNGYEVCDYVKKDSRFAHVPVVLLVGAFDPLDEREAQRVAADGILKKPFVPPDPLIAMVKTLLDRSQGERLVTVGAPQTSAAEQGGAGTLTHGSVSAVKVEGRPPVPAAPPAPAPAPPQELTPEEEFQPQPADHLTFAEGEQPIAFGQLLQTPVQNSAAAEAPAIEPVEPITDDQVLTSARDANLGEPIFWKPEEPEAEEGEAGSEEEDAQDFLSGSWDLSEPSHNEDAERAASGKAHTDAVIEPVQPVAPIEPFELVRDDTAEAGAIPAVVEPSSLIAQDAAAQASLTVESGKAPNLAANPLEWMATAPPQHVEEAPEMEAPWNAEESASEEHEETPREEEHAETPMELAPETTLPPPPPLGVIPAPSLLGMTPHPVTPQAVPSAPAQANAPTPMIEPRKTPTVVKPLGQSPEDTARSIPKQDWTDLAAGLDFKLAPSAPSAEKPKSPPIPPPAPPSSSPVIKKSASAPENGSADSAPDPALVEAVVQRVLDKMRPQVVDIITKEFLRPVVQALVHREINKH